MTEREAGDVDAAVRRRIREMERLLSSVAHRLGAVILPSLDKGVDTSDRWVRRLEMVATTLSEHVVREKRALDIVRGRDRGELEPATESEWNELVPGVLQGLAPSCGRLTVALTTDAPIDLHLTRAITTTVIALDEQVVEGAEVEVDVQSHEGALSLTARWSPESPVTVPMALERSWADVGEFAIDAAPGRLSLSGGWRDGAAELS